MEGTVLQYCTSGDEEAQLLALMTMWTAIRPSAVALTAPSITSYARLPSPKPAPIL
jgi:hypothetical protein